MSILALAFDPQTSTLVAAALGQVLFWQLQAVPNVQAVLWQGSQGWASWAAQPGGGMLVRSETGGLLLKKMPGGVLGYLDPPPTKINPQINLKVAIEPGVTAESNTIVATVENAQSAGSALWPRWELYSRSGGPSLHSRYHFVLPPDQMKIEPGATVQVRIPISLRSQWWPLNSFDYCLGIRPLYGELKIICQDVAAGPWWWRRGRFLFLVIVISTGTIGFVRRSMRFPAMKMHPTSRIPLAVRKIKNKICTPTHPTVKSESRSSGTEPRYPFRILLHYAAADAGHAAELRKHLAPLVREGLVELMAPLLPGALIIEGHLKQLSEADAFLALISADYLATEDCHALLCTALDMPCDKIAIMPVMIREANLEGTLLEGRKALPEDGRAVSEWPSFDAAWKNVVQAVRIHLSSQPRC